MFIKLKNSLKKINKNIKTSSKNSDKLYMVIFFDMLICKIIYQIDSYEYTLYELYNLSYNKRKTYLSKFK